MNEITDRKLLEAEFHNHREADRLSLSETDYEKKYSNKRFYKVGRASVDYEDDWLKKHCNGKAVLDYCTGLGETALRLAKLGAVVYGIDIAEKEVATAKKLLESHGFENAKFVVGDAEASDFPDNTFDVIVCNGVLHHLDIHRAWAELSRILKPGGKIIAMEALGYNPLIQLYRRMTPHLRTAWETEHILTHNELRAAKKYFDGISVRYFHLAVLFAIPFINTPIFKPLLRTLEMVDRLILTIPGIRLMAWQMVFELSKPKKL